MSQVWLLEALEFAPQCMKILVNRDSHSKSKLRIINSGAFSKWPLPSVLDDFG